jgi:predicted amidohydrolase YtcJ
MKTAVFRLSLETLLLLLGAVSWARAQGTRLPPADTVLLHGRIYTENPKQPWAAALAIRGSKIVAVGDDAEIEKMRGTGTQAIDAGGRLVLPGFVDSHIHFFEGSIFLDRLHLEGTKSIREIQERLRDYAATHPGDGWLIGAGWDYAAMGSKREER